MNVHEALTKTQDALTVKRVYGEPYERDGIVVIPAAEIRGGGGGGDGEDTTRGSSGSGGGFAITARPVGAYVIDRGQVRWKPAIDATRLLGHLLTAVGITVVLRRNRS